eukprot:12759705-Alexandrium_andersonii.AAC.1
MKSHSPSQRHHQVRAVARQAADEAGRDTNSDTHITEVCPGAPYGPGADARHPSFGRIVRCPKMDHRSTRDGVVAAAEE